MVIGEINIKRKKRQGRVAFIFLLPFLTLLFLFRIIPVISIFFLSLTSYDVLSPPRWIGLLNFRELIFSSSAAARIFWVSVGNTLYFTAGQVSLEMIVGLALALLVNNITKIKVRSLFTTAYYLPVVTSIVAISMIWLWLYQPQFGLFNYFLKKIGLPPQQWLADPDQAMPSVILVAVWQGAGWSMIIYLAGLQGIPQSLYESSKLDGANRWQTFWHITLPCLRPVTLFIVIMSCITALQVFTQIYVLTQGGPLNRTTTVGYYIWNNSFRFYRMGFGSAMALILFLVILTISLTNQKFFGKEVGY